MNIPLLRQVQGAVLLHAASFDMGVFFRGPVMSAANAELDIVAIHDELTHDCGSACCLAGWILALTGTPIFPTMNYDELAGEIAQLTHEQATTLFFATNWGNANYRDYMTATTTRERAQVAWRVIDEFIESGGVLPEMTDLREVSHR